MNVIGIVGWKNCGKTTLASALIRELSSRGLTVNSIKHAHHGVDVDQPGTDSYHHRDAGAREVILAGGQRFAIMHELRGADEPTLDELLARLGTCDWVVVEGFKSHSHPKIEVHRRVCPRAPLYPNNASIIAVAADYASDFAGPGFDLNDVPGIADFILGPREPSAQESHQPKKAINRRVMNELRNDCFALPPGVNWTPVDEALERLRSRLHPVVGVDRAVPLLQLNGRILASDVYAPRAHPPSSNSAVDGYAFAGPLSQVPCAMPLVDGRSAAGEPYIGHVPEGHAIRILTGAVMPAGTDTVVLEEDCEVIDQQLHLNGTLRAGANSRKAGEDIKAQDRILTVATRLTPTQISVLASVGVESVNVYQRLRVGILSTGDEVKPVGSAVTDWQIYDANRPMLSALVAQLGYQVVDLGHVLDRAEDVKAALERGAEQCDLILTSGGVSAGDEDHVSKTLKAHGEISNWRIAIKPGRPLALAMFQGTPVVGLPGNPVAAWVCTLRFGAPAMSLLAGGEWFEPQGYVIPANFYKNKKPGRSEMLRARVRKGQVEVFGSEGSGRVTGLAWSEGMVELDENAQQIEPGTPVRYIPYASFGL